MRLDEGRHDYYVVGRECYDGAVEYLSWEGVMVYLFPYNELVSRYPTLEAAEIEAFRQVARDPDLVGHVRVFRVSLWKQDGQYSVGRV